MTRLLAEVGKREKGKGTLLSHASPTPVPHLHEIFA
jgi:hypothetical protein